MRGEGGGAVHVGDAQGAAGAEGRIGFGERLDGVAADDGGIVGTGDAHFHRMGRAVSGLGLEAVGVDLTDHKLVARAVHGV